MREWLNATQAEPPFQQTDKDEPQEHRQRAKQNGVPCLWLRGVRFGLWIACLVHRNVLERLMMQGRRKAESSLIVPDDKPWVQNECGQGNPFRRTKKAMPPGGASPVCCSETTSENRFDATWFPDQSSGYFLPL